MGLQDTVRLQVSGNYFSLFLPFCLPFHTSDIGVGARKIRKVSEIRNERGSLRCDFGNEQNSRYSRVCIFFKLYAGQENKVGEVVESNQQKGFAVTS